MLHVYYNLRTGLWSLRCAVSRRVIDHRATVALRDCRFRVSEAGRLRVLRDKRRSVHAWVEGVLCEGSAPAMGPAVRYNPYRAATFEVAAGDGWEPIHAAGCVFFDLAGKCRLAGLPE